MKKYIFVILLLGFFSKCKDKDAEFIPPVITTAGTDALAAWEAYEIGAASAPFCAVTPACNLIMISGAVIIGAEASGAFNRVNNNIFEKGEHNYNVSLSAKYVNNLNPYEIIGIKHNLVLDYINRKKNPTGFSEKLRNYNFNEWKEVLLIVETNISDSEINEQIRNAKINDVFSIKRTNRYLNVKTYSDLINEIKISYTLSESAKLNLIEVLKLVNELIIKKDFEGALLFLKNSINSMINPKGIYTKDERQMIVLLTTLKHSSFYWNFK